MKRGNSAAGRLYGEPQATDAKPYLCVAAPPPLSAFSFFPIVLFPMRFFSPASLFSATLLAGSLSFVACQQQAETIAADTAVVTENSEALPPLDSIQVRSYGERITEDGAQPMAELPTLLAGKDSVKLKLVGEISDVCQVKGCWMDMQTADGQPVKVRFKDYAFFVPKTTKGKTTIVEGWAYKQTVPVDELRHYAEDAGKSKAEIAAITQPQEALRFEADGVLIKQ